MADNAFRFLDEIPVPVQTQNGEAYTRLYARPDGSTCSVLYDAVEMVIIDYSSRQCARAPREDRRTAAESCDALVRNTLDSEK